MGRSEFTVFDAGLAAAGVLGQAGCAVTVLNEPSADQGWLPPDDQTEYSGHAMNVIGVQTYG